MQRPYILYLDILAINDNYLRKLAGIQRYAAARGWEVETLSREETSRVSVKALCDRSGGRDVPIGCIAETSGMYHVLPPSLFGNIPVVYLDPPKPLPWRGTGMVTCDNIAVAKAAFGELSIGKPSCFAAVPSGTALPWNRARIDAFASLCSTVGQKLRVFPHRRGEESQRRIARLTKWLASLPKRSAVFAANDETARDVANAARTIPRHIPKELVILGADGEPGVEDRGTFHTFGERPGLSSVKLDFELAGYEAARLVGEYVAAKNGKSTKTNTASFAAGNKSATFGPLCILRRESTRGAGRRDPSVLEAVETIRREACNGLTAATLAESFPASRKHFERRFREAMGHPILDEILHVRLEKAQTLLLRRDVPIRDIAGLCGFRTGIELRKLFRLRFGVPMRQWRHEHAPEDLI